MPGTQDKTYIFRKYFGFDVQSIIFQFNKIIDFQDSEYYFYGDEMMRLGNNALQWADFYSKWLCNLDSIETVFLEFIENAEANLWPVYETSSDTLKKQLRECFVKNTKEVVKEEFLLGVVRKAFEDEDEY